jgi:hypothetical protein
VYMWHDVKLSFLTFQDNVFNRLLTAAGVGDRRVREIIELRELQKSMRRDFIYFCKGLRTTAFSIHE